MKLLILSLFSALLFSSCSQQKAMNQDAKTPKKNTSGGIMPGPATLIYKTKNEYRLLVPIILSEDKTKIVSYPHPTDLKTAGKFSYPTRLAQGYLLDNRGINKNVAFLSLTYEAYAALPQKPDTTELRKWILDDDPLTVLFFCGSRRQYEENNIAEQLNEVIRKNEVGQQFQRIK